MTMAYWPDMAKRLQRPEDMARGARLKTARLEAGYETGAEAADALDMNYSVYNNHELGWRGITRKTARRYADFFGVSLDWLYENVGPRKGGKQKETPDLLDGLPPKGRQEAVDFIDYLKTKYGV